MDEALQVTITIVGVVTGIALTEWAIRVRDRRQRIEEATIELAMLVPRVVVTIWDGWQGDRPDTGLDSPWSERYENVTKLVGEVRAKARWPLRSSARIRSEAEDLAARLAAAQMNWMQRRVPIRGDDIHEITTADLYGLVFTRLQVLDDAVGHYMAHGYGTRPPRESG